MCQSRWPGLLTYQKIPTIAKLKFSITDLAGQVSAFLCCICMHAFLVGVNVCLFVHMNLFILLTLDSLDRRGRPSVSSTSISPVSLLPAFPQLFSSSLESMLIRPGCCSVIYTQLLAPPGETLTSNHSYTGPLTGGPQSVHSGSVFPVTAHAD